MLVVPVRLREIPERALRLAVAASTQDGGARVFVAVLVGLLPDVADQVHHPKRAGASWMCINIGCSKHPAIPCE